MSKYSDEWVRRAIAGEVTGRDASAVQALVAGLQREHGTGLVPKVTQAIEAWSTSDQAGDPDRPDYWKDFVRVADASIRNEASSG